jgi:putative membrane protein
MEVFMYPNMFSGGMWFNWLWVIIIAIIAWFVMDKFIRSQKRNNNNFLKESAMNILKRRYAKGEIGKEEFDKLKNDLI